MDLSTDRRLVAAMTLLADEYDLPRKDYLKQQIYHAEPAVLGGFADRYVRAAWHELQKNLSEAFNAKLPSTVGSPEGLPPAAVTGPWPRDLMQATIAASGLAYDIRATAQGVRGPAPDPRVWAALVALLTVLVIRARVASADPHSVHNSVKTVVAAMEKM